ncbi:hypothetical protein [Deinococcus pimensis]|uniref:hypothetical protein n=1 Tax=Deinococcus pimensis TaxID=309888 RepID=UPI0004843CC0|nr:hypothetical protein [Deinococcus pimensis]
MDTTGKQLLDLVEAGLKARADLRTARHTDAERQRVTDTEEALTRFLTALLTPEVPHEDAPLDL